MNNTRVGLYSGFYHGLCGYQRASNDLHGFKTNEVILCTFTSKLYVFNEHRECNRLQYAV